MSESKHTPGPWEAVKETNSSRGWLVWPSARECQEPYPIAGITLKGKLGEEDANARLIAAAPDMAEALDNLLTWAEHSGFEIDLQDAQVWFDARAALALARGEKP